MTTVAAEAHSSCSVIAAVAEPGFCFAIARPPLFALRAVGPYGIDLKLLFSSDKGISNDPYVKALFDRKKPGWVGYPGIFFDQQLAACATIAFVKNEGSTFSNFINELRKDNLSETCNRGIDLP